jgi:hypothetical protein
MLKRNMEKTTLTQWRKWSDLTIFMRKGMIWVKWETG